MTDARATAADDVEAPQDDQVYHVEIGGSLQEDETAPGCSSGRNTSAPAFCSFRYEFQPASVDTSVAGLVSVDDSNGVQVLLANSLGAPGGITFKGKVTENKDVDCLLVFDGEKFVLERCRYAFTQLRHVRTPAPARKALPSQTPVPSQLPATVSAATKGKKTRAAAPRKATAATKLTNDQSKRSDDHAHAHDYHTHTQRTMASKNKRRDTDVMKLMMSNYEVHLTDETKTSDFDVKFHGPIDSPYEGGIWKIHVSLPKDYPFKSPSIGFVNRVYHPNVDEMSGSVCLDVINQTWSPMFDLVNVFDVFIPQLLRYPNPTDPLNGEAASLLMKDMDTYNNKVKEYVKSFASHDIVMDEEEDDSDVSDMSDVEC
ncbi:TPA: hypothetical protein N0F65_002003 [Lagenidium giganteum]|uniref:UBC core domain-containing protein n=1 Tax=Lagenidium giganteum TaxID=4803 RepID=A0AAV2Z2M4_9STRA|nr:TPA: hypothetical protein N0F65_002003 [Lagenidium giganteum]